MTALTSFGFMCSLNVQFSDIAKRWRAELQRKLTPATIVGKACAT
jgi:hypothetical protein